MKKNKLKFAIRACFWIINVITILPAFSQNVQESKDVHSCTDRLSDKEGKNYMDNRKDLSCNYTSTEVQRYSNDVTQNIDLRQEYGGFNKINSDPQCHESSKTEILNTSNCYPRGEKWFCPYCRRLHSCQEFDDYSIDGFSSYTNGCIAYYLYNNPCKFLPRR